MEPPSEEEAFLLEWAELLAKWFFVDLLIVVGAGLFLKFQDPILPLHAQELFVCLRR